MRGLMHKTNPPFEAWNSGLSLFDSPFPCSHLSFGCTELLMWRLLKSQHTRFCQRWFLKPVLHICNITQVRCKYVQCFRSRLIWDCPQETYLWKSSLLRMNPGWTKQTLVLRNSQDLSYTPLWYHRAFPAGLITTSFVHFPLLDQIQQQYGEREANPVFLEELPRDWLLYKSLTMKVFSQWRNSWNTK